MNSKTHAGNLSPALKVSETLKRLLMENAKEFGALVEDLAEGRTPVVFNLEGSALALVAACVQDRMSVPLLFLTAGLERAEELADDLDFFGGGDVLHYPKWEVLPYDQEDLSIEVTAKHLDVFEALSEAGAGGGKGTPPVIVAPVDALMQRVLPAARLEDLGIRLSWGERVDLEGLLTRLTDAGYERVALVEARGEFSLRNSIVDIYPPNSEDPIRLDLFGDEIESIRRFDVATQRSLEDLGTEAKISISGCRLKHHIEEHVEGGGRLCSLFELLPSNTILVLDSPERFEEVTTYFQSAVERQYHEILHENSTLGPPENLLLDRESLCEFLGRFRRMEHRRSPGGDDESGKTPYFFRTGSFDASMTDLKSWISQIRRKQTEDFLIVITCDNEGQVLRLEEVLREHELSVRAVLDDSHVRDFSVRSVIEGYPDIVLVVGNLHEGFLFHDARIALITDREMFGRYKRRHLYKKLYKGRPIAASNEIRRGDFVVHVEHGVGKYAGMRQQQLDGRTVDLLEIEYAEGDKLLVPVEKIRYVQKYASGQSEKVTLDNLGSGRWKKRKGKSRAEIERMAQALLELNARREVARRKPFGGDTALYNEFEASFPWQETPDQGKAIDDVKGDMGRGRPMDRLLCGDVGYGKTEVAIRAVFKCVEEKRQAAVLVPTTILALQHDRSFRDRFADYPIRVALLSRFQSAKEAREIKKGLASGEVQVVIGTHKLLGKDMEFHDLGLVVVDEEQRFGVKAKDRLKELRSEVDVLTLTATPIPRTLHMAMAGLRDLSLITTPPPDRHPIRTRVITWEEEPIAEAILRELNRGGQVFFIHNRVHSIEQVADRIRKIARHARVGVAHGQMKESELEDHMLKFIQGEYDILVSTTIVESGIDIPNANTIIVNRADAFGLAQLYQLRGRVGRERRRAYAYLIVPQGQAITDQAVKRLAAIEEFTELGSGFSIAMRDMEIRGAGDLLGKEQHGIVTEIGFELYCEMLQEAVSDLRGDKVPDPHDVELRWPISCYLPAPYIPVETQRVNFYKRVAMIRSEVDLADIGSELQDRYGALPEPARSLLDVARLRIAAAQLGVRVVEGGGDAARVTFASPSDVPSRKFHDDAVRGLDAIASVRVQGERILAVNFNQSTDSERVVSLAEFLLKFGEASGLTAESGSNQVPLSSKG